MPTTSHDGRLPYTWVIAGMTFPALPAASGVRSSVRVFIKPLERDFGWERGPITLAAAPLPPDDGASGPLVGRLVDRWSPRRVLAGSVLLCGAGALLSATVTRLWHLSLWAEVPTAGGAGGAALVTASALAAREFDERRGLPLGRGPRLRGRGAQAADPGGPAGPPRSRGGGGLPRRRHGLGGRLAGLRLIGDRTTRDTYRNRS